MSIVEPTVLESDLEVELWNGPQDITRESLDDPASWHKATLPAGTRLNDRLRYSPGNEFAYMGAVVPCGSSFEFRITLTKLVELLLTSRS